MFINAEAFKETIPCQIIREDNIWFLKHKEKQTVYAFLVEDNWKFGERRTFQIKSLRATYNTQISVLGHNGKVLEYNPEVYPAPTISNKANFIEISIMRAQRIYNDKEWPNPIVVKLEGIEFLEAKNK